MSNLPRVVLTGGVSGGHTFPLIAVARTLQTRYPQGIEFLFIGSEGTFESNAMSAAGIPVKYVLYGKMRRYFSLLNYLDAFKLPIGFVTLASAVVHAGCRVFQGRGGFRAGRPRGSPLPYPGPDP